MIIVRLQGGLGNQMFQYATGFALAAKKKTELYLDLSAFLDHNLRAYRMGEYPIRAEIASPEEINHFLAPSSRRWRRVLHWLFFKLLPSFHNVIVNETSLSYDPNPLNMTGNLYLVGYWQSEKYFRDCGSQIRQELTPRQAIQFQEIPIFRQIQNNEKAVSLHIRRGDYVSDPVINAYHGVCSMDYYLEAVNKMASMLTNPHFFVFSDDVEWARTNLQLPHPVTYVLPARSLDDVRDLYLMSCCQHHIIANSSFSWWGAWLSPNPSKIVIAPRRWYANPEIKNDDLIPESWIRL